MWVVYSMNKKESLFLINTATSIESLLLLNFRYVAILDFFKCKFVKIRANNCKKTRFAKGSPSSNVIVCYHVKKIKRNNLGFRMFANIQK